MKQRDTLSRIDLALAIALTIAAIYLHVVNAFAAGGMWRDEANTIVVATLPRLGDVWRNLQFDSFPVLGLLLVRAIANICGPMNDHAFRVSGFLVGFAVITALWLNAWSFRRAAPLLSLAVLALNPADIHWGDSARLHGLGALMTLVMSLALWRFVRRPDRCHFVIAAIVAISSVNISFYNAVILFAFCAGGAAVFLAQRQWKNIAAVILIGALAAVSLVPYWAMIRGASSWVHVVRMPAFTFARLFTKLPEAFGRTGHRSFIVWLVLSVLTLLFGIASIAFPRWLELSTDQKDAAIFSSVALLVGSVGFFVFLRVLSYPTEPWYYLYLIALSAVCIDATLGALVRSAWLRIARIGVVAIFAAGILPGALQLARTRLTNVDVIASRVSSAAEPGDVILVTPWHHGITFGRYYRGSAQWSSIPSLPKPLYHRWDIMNTEMQLENQTSVVQPIVDAAAGALRKGHRVFIVTGWPFWGQHSAVLPRAPLPGDQWPLTTYQRQWSAMVASYLQNHAITVKQIPVHTGRAVNGYEYSHLLVVAGWKP